MSPVIEEATRSHAPRALRIQNPGLGGLALAVAAGVILSVLWRFGAGTLLRLLIVTRQQSLDLRRDFALVHRRAPLLVLVGQLKTNKEQTKKCQVRNKHI